MSEQQELKPKLSLIEWMEERRDNCLRLGGVARGNDRAGWEEDAAYFHAAVLALSTRPREDALVEALTELVNAQLSSNPRDYGHAMTKARAALEGR